MKGLLIKQQSIKLTNGLYLNYDGAKPPVGFHFTSLAFVDAKPSTKDASITMLTFRHTTQGVGNVWVFADEATILNSGSYRLDANKDEFLVELEVAQFENRLPEGKLTSPRTIKKR